MNVFFMFSPLVLVEEGNNTAALWTPGVQKRSTYHNILRVKNALWPPMFLSEKAKVILCELTCITQSENQRMVEIERDL